MKNFFLIAFIGIFLLSASCSSETKTIGEITTTQSSKHSNATTDKSNVLPNVLEDENKNPEISTNANNAPEEEPRKLCTGKDYTEVLAEDVPSKVNFADFSPEVQSFNIDPRKENVLKAASGTKFIVPAYSFTGKDPVTVKIQEYFGKELAYTQQLTTMTTAGEWLESAGMFHIEAFANGQKTDLREGAEIILETVKLVDAEMGIYYGEKAENGDVYWNYDSLGTTLAPVAVMMMGSLKQAVGPAFSVQYKFDKAKMISLVGKRWTTSASFDRDGNMIGTTKCGNSSETPEDVACNAFFELLPTMKKELFGGNYQRWASEFIFTAMSQDEFIKMQNAALLESEMAKAIKNFTPRNADGRKYFTIGSLGFVNIDKPIRLPDFAPKEDVMVRVENGQEEVKLLFKKRNMVLSGELNNGFYVFKNVPVGAEVELVGSYAKGTQIFYAKETQKVTKSNNSFVLSYEPCAVDVLKEKLAALN